MLQHQYSGLTVDTAAATVSVGLSFGGVPAKLVIPVAAITAFADPEVQFGLRFGGVPAGPAVEVPEAAVPEAEMEAGTEPDEQPQVVSLDAFRRRKD